MSISFFPDSKRRKLLLQIAISLCLFLLGGFFFYIYNINLSVLIFIVLLAVYVKNFYAHRHLPSWLDLLLLLLIALMIVVLTTITFKLPVYAISAIGFIILITQLFDDFYLSFIYAIIISLMAGGLYQGGEGFLVSISLLCGSLTALMLSYRCRTRFNIIRAGLIAGLIQFLAAFIGEKIYLSSNYGHLYLNLLKICFFNGLISPMIVLGVLPIGEYIFRVVTNISLLELSDFNHPLLKKMIFEAPGTYQHSLVVANLAEAAAESIGANPLLARVGAYYHDVGKIPKAHYFVENQIPYRDMHKDLKPSISKLIIIKHVKEGVELAKKYHLNPRIIDFITQHHGRSLIYYFYHRAKEIENGQNQEEEYRYPGPKPQSREVAIVSLADTIEALSRTLEDPTPSRIEEMVKDVVRKKFSEGELDESDLTLKDLEKITQSFIRVLNAIFHTRINYPQDDTNKKPTKNTQD